jgi:acyl-coenzyme A synthetase/AMP-(fatty) acid ligase
VITAGAPLSAETAARFRAATGLPVHVFYGASECGGICFDRDGGAAERGTVGEPVEGVEIGFSCREAASGGAPTEAGVVTVRSAAVAAGYVPDPGSAAVLGGGRFVASDLGTFRGGELALLGRTDDLVNVRGKKVNPREVETVLAQLSGVVEVAVFGVLLPHRKDEVLRAVVACRPGDGLSAEQVRAFCGEHLAAHKVPRSVILVPEMPRTSRGKLDRGALRALRPAAAGAPDERL